MTTIPRDPRHAVGHLARPELCPPLTQHTDRAERGSFNVGRARGFTLVELMVVVVIIAVVAALTIPNITRRMKERRAGEAAQKVALLFQQARTQAMGRGSAVLVRYTQPLGRAMIELREAQRGTGVAAGCEALPMPSCTNTAWNNVDAPLQQYRVLTSLDLTRHAEYEEVSIDMFDAANVQAAFVDICFTPMGRTFVRTSDALAFGPLTGIFRAEVMRGGVSGLIRDVLILPNGVARVTARERPSI